MTVRDWIVSRTPTTLPELTQRILEALGDDSSAPDSRAGELCLGAAARSLETLVSEGRFDRRHALDLLAIDALTTFAYEHASQPRAAGTGTIGLADLARRGTVVLGHTLDQRV